MLHFMGPQSIAHNLAIEQQQLHRTREKKEVQCVCRTYIKHTLNFNVMCKTTFFPEVTHSIHIIV